MSEAIGTAPDGSSEDVYSHVTADLAEVLNAKKRDVQWKLKAVRAQFENGDRARAKAD